jgi:hypothetical protein
MVNFSMQNCSEQKVSIIVFVSVALVSIIYASQPVAILASGDVAASGEGIIGTSGAKASASADGIGISVS